MQPEKSCGMRRKSKKIAVQTAKNVRENAESNSSCNAWQRILKMTMKALSDFYYYSPSDSQI